MPLTNLGVTHSVCVGGHRGGVGWDGVWGWGRVESSEDLKPFVHEVP